MDRLIRTQQSETPHFHTQEHIHIHTNTHTQFAVFLGTTPNFGILLCPTNLPEQFRSCKQLNANKAFFFHQICMLAHSLSILYINNQFARLIFFLDDCFAANLSCFTKLNDHFQSDYQPKRIWRLFNRIFLKVRFD